MGNSSSSSGRNHQDDTVDFGNLIPQGVYTGHRDWNQAIVAQLIGERKLAPFYRPLEDYEEDWDDEQILAARKELPDASQVNGDSATRAEAISPSASAISTKSGHSKKSSLKEPAKPEASIYRGAVECPICFLVSLPRSLRPRLITSQSQVLSAKYQPFALLRPGHLHRVFCADKTKRAHSNTYRV